MNTEPQRRWLQPGQAQSLWLERGTHLLVQQGRATFVLPAQGWLGLGPQVTLTLPAGSAHQLRDGGSVRLEAAGSRSAVVLLIAPQCGVPYTAEPGWPSRCPAP
jgi:mannose-6-phosphate isomerase-like protein (cupin superfamily)